MLILSSFELKIEYQDKLTLHIQSYWVHNPSHNAFMSFGKSALSRGLYPTGTLCNFIKKHIAHATFAFPIGPCQ